MHNFRPISSPLFQLAIVTSSALLGASSLAAQVDLSEVQIPHHKLVLENGLTVIVHEDHSVPIVAVNLWYHVGSRNEVRGRTGFAHLFEHFFFNGSENYPHGFREAMDDLGVNNRNGTTSTDRTNFFEDVPVSGLERTLYLEADRMGFLAGRITEEALTRERGVVQNEKRQGENQPYGQAFTRIVEAIYPYSHPYSWSTIGKMEDLDAARLDDVIGWYRTFYGPNNCVLSLAGDITLDRARALVEKYFGSIPPGPPLPRYETWVPRLERDIREVIEDRVPQARIYRVYHAPPWGDPDLARLGLAAGVLSGSKSSPLDRRLVYELELATMVAAFVNDGELASSLILIVQVKPGVDPMDAERELDRVVAELIANGPQTAELDRAKSRELASFVRGMERLGGFGGRSDILAESMTYGGTPDAYLDRLRLVGDATPQAVHAAVRSWLDTHHYTLTVVPFPKLAGAEPPSDLDRSVLPALGEAPDVAFPRIQRARLQNGLQVMLMERRGAPLVNLTLAVDAGYASDAGGLAGTASLALELMEEGTTSRDGFALADALDALGASVSTGSSLDLSFVRLRALAGSFDPALEIFADVVQNPAFDPQMFELARRRRLAAIAQEKAQPVATALRLMPPLLYGAGHPYSNPLTGSGDEKSVGALEREALRAWHQRWIRPERSTIIAAGAISLPDLMAALERRFAGWQTGADATKELPVVASGHAGKIYLIDKPGAPQSVIVAAHLSESGGRPEDLPMETVMRLFGGMSTSRLNRNLRLDKHWSYGVSGMLMDARGQRPFLVIAPVQTDKTKESMLEVLSEIRAIAGQRPIEGEEFASIQRNMTLRLAGRFETLSSLEQAGVSLVAYGQPSEFYYDYGRNVRALAPADLNRAAATYVRPQDLVWLVIGDLSLVEEGIRGLGLGEVTRLDADGQPVAAGAPR